MPARDPEPSVWIAWVAFVTLPVMAFLTRVGWYGMRAEMALRLSDSGMAFEEIARAFDVGRWLLVTGVLGGALAGLILGPHLLMGFGVVMLSGGLAWAVVDGSALPFWLTSVGAGITWVSLLASAGVSAGGGAPGLRYGTFVAIYAATNAAGILGPVLVGAAPWMPPVAASSALLVLPFPLLTWWLAKSRPREPDEGATGRVGLIAAVIFVLLLSAQACFTLLEPLYGALTEDWERAVNPVVVMATAVPTILALLALQVAKLPARFGVMAGLAALILSVAATLAWSMGPTAPAVALLALTALAEVFLYPWAYARMTSDAHWRLATLFAAFAILPAYVLSEPGEIVAVLAAMIVSVLAIPIAGLGWMADTWIFGDEPGPIERRRGRR